MESFIIQAVVWSLWAEALWISYSNNSRYVEARQDPELARRSLGIALHARSDAGIGEAEFDQIQNSHYRPYLKRSRVALAVALCLAVVGVVLLIV